MESFKSSEAGVEESAPSHSAEHSYLPSLSKIDFLIESHLGQFTEHSYLPSLSKIDCLMCLWILLILGCNTITFIKEMEEYFLTNRYIHFCCNMTKRMLILYKLWVLDFSILYIILLTSMAELMCYFEPLGNGIIVDKYSEIEGKFFKFIINSLNFYSLETYCHIFLPKRVHNTYHYWVKWISELTKHIQDENIREVVRCLEETCPRYVYNIKNMFSFWGPWICNWGGKWGLHITKEQVQVLFRMLYHLQFPRHKSYPQSTYTFLPESLADYVKSFREGENPVVMTANALHISIECGKPKKVHEVLTATDININGMATLKVIQPFPLTPLMIACNSDLPEAGEILAMLLKQRKLHLNVRTANNLTALKIAFEKAVKDRNRLGCLIQLLKDPRINVNIKLEDNRTILMIVIQTVKDEELRQEMIMHLIRHPQMDVNVSEKCGNNYTALHHAVIQDQPLTVKTLLAMADIQLNVRTKGQDTPLILAASKNLPNCLEIVKLLTSHPKININAQNSKRYTAANFAQETGNTHLISFLYANDKFDPSKNQPKLTMLKSFVKSSEDSEEEVKKKRVKCCWNCGKDDIKLYKCGGCKKAFYCSDSCIQKDWEIHGGWCVKIKGKRKNKKITEIVPKQTEFLDLD